jgi:hypothetical protein
LIVNHLLAILFKAPRCGAGSISSTVSDGRHSFTPRGIVRPLGIVEPKFIIGRAFMPEQFANSNPHALDEIEQ